MKPKEKKKKTERVGIFGGKFNPLHGAHLAIAGQAKKQLKLDRVIFIPVYIQPGMSVYPSVNAADRLRMLELAVKGRKGFEVSGVEIRRKKVSYTIDTLNYIRHRLPTAELFLIIGADNLAQFHLWKSYKRILKLVSLAVYKRRGFNSALRSRFEYELIKGDLFRFSSTDIRKRINRKMPVKGIIPKKVLKYITDRSLYSNEEE